MEAQRFSRTKLEVLGFAKQIPRKDIDTPSGSTTTTQTAQSCRTISEVPVSVAPYFELGPIIPKSVPPRKTIKLSFD